MMVKLITYTDDRMTISAQNLRDSALIRGVDQVKIYTPDDLDPDFRETMKDVLSQERGAGFYCWKPYIVADAIKHMTASDILIWCDAGSDLVDNVYKLIEAMPGDNLFFSNGWNHVDWCKMDLIKRVFPDYGDDSLKGDHITKLINEAKQLQASHFVIRCTSRMKGFIQAWLDITKEPGMIDNNPSVSENIVTFREHRWDQSILCCLQIMYGFKLHWFPSLTGFHIKDAHPEDKYPAMFNHHRKRNDEW